jgi:hypothetical protein
LKVVDAAPGEGTGLGNLNAPFNPANIPTSNPKSNGGAGGGLFGGGPNLLAKSALVKIGAASING